MILFLKNADIYKFWEAWYQNSAFRREFFLPHGKFWVSYKTLIPGVVQYPWKICNCNNYHSDDNIVIMTKDNHDSKMHNLYNTE